MKKNCSIIVLISLLIFLCITPIHHAGECTYGSVEAWFRTVAGPWENATAHPVLSRGEYFEIKINVSIKTDLRVVYIKLHEFGTSVYEVIMGPSIMEQLLELWKPTQSHPSWTYSWTMRVKTNTSWINGNSPLELYVQFTKNDNDDASVTFDVINALIIDSLREPNSSLIPVTNVSLPKNDSHRLTSLSSYEIMLVVILVNILVIMIRKRHSVK
jgi:sarcinarray family protein